MIEDHHLGCVVGAREALGSMALDVAKLRKLVALDESDPLSRFALAQALLREGDTAAITEAADHLLFANAADPDHLATYHLLGQVLISLDRKEEARRVLTAGRDRAEAAESGKGHDLGPAFEQLLETL